MVRGVSSTEFYLSKPLSIEEEHRPRSPHIMFVTKALISSVKGLTAGRDYYLLDGLVDVSGKRVLVKNASPNPGDWNGYRAFYHDVPMIFRSYQDASYQLVGEAYTFGEAVKGRTSSDKVCLV